MEVEWERQLVRVETRVEPVPRHQGSAGLSVSDELARLAAEQPSEAIVAAFDRMTLRLRPYLTGGEPQTERPYSRLGEKVRAAVGNGRLNADTAGAVEGMQRIRNLAAHDAGEISPPRAAKYLALADAVINSLAGEKKAGSA